MVLSIDALEVRPPIDALSAIPAISCVDQICNLPSLCHFDRHWFWTNIVSVGGSNQIPFAVLVNPLDNEPVVISAMSGHKQLDRVRFGERAARLWPRFVRITEENRGQCHVADRNLALFN